jgi:hypothetical protein
MSDGPDPAQRLAQLERDVAELEAILGRLLRRPASAVSADVAVNEYEEWEARRRPERRG